MPGLSRRTLFKRTSAGAAALGALIAAPQTLGRQTQTAMATPVEHGSAMAAAASAPAAPVSTEPLVAYVRNRATGEIAIFSGTREIVLHDSALVSRLLQAGS